LHHVEGGCIRESQPIVLTASISAHLCYMRWDRLKHICLI
jgi:hypothetical protein